jgi:uncharacterized protein (DUF433 family)
VGSRIGLPGRTGPCRKILTRSRSTLLPVRYIKQYIIDMPLSVVVSDTRRDIEALSDRSRDAGKIERARFVSHNALVIAGTRIPVATIKQFSEDGYSVEQILKEYPTLTEEDVKAAIKHKGDGMAA